MVECWVAFVAGFAVFLAGVQHMVAELAYWGIVVYQHVMVIVLDLLLIIIRYY